MKETILIRSANSSDAEAIWHIIEAVIKGGDTYVFDPDSPKDKMLNYWLAPDKRPYVAVIDHQVVGTFLLKDNQPGLGSHIANAAYMVNPEHRGKNIGKTMALFSIEEARRLNYFAMQFNMVIETNKPAIGLWKKLGFEIIGKSPAAFNHRTLGLTDALIMYKRI